MAECDALGRTLLAALAAGLGLHGDMLLSRFAEPTQLFRIFSYPPHDPKNVGSFAVGEHTDYGWLTILLQDGSGGK